MGRLSARNARFHGDGSPIVVLAHGIGGQQAHWDAVVERVKGRATVLTYALPGSPGAVAEDFPTDRYSSALAFADDICALLREVDRDDVVFVGHSLAAIAGLLAAAAEPELFAGLVTINGSPRYTDDPVAGYEGGLSPKAVAGIIQSVDADYMSWAAGFAPQAIGALGGGRAARALRQSLQSYRPDVAASMIRASLEGDYREHMPRVVAPTRVLQSRDDALVPEATGRWLSEELPDARYRELQSTGHFPHLVDPDEVAREIGAFLDQLA